MMRPLEGITVVSVEQAVAAPLCTCRLADAGARVIKVERPGGDFARGYDHAVLGESTYFTWINRGKESIVLNLRDPADAALLKRMIGAADVFVHNMSPEAARRQGLDPDLLLGANPRLIVCAISGYGDEGPKKDAKAYDLLIQCETGLAAITGGPESPGRVGISVADISCGVTANAAILEALLQRERTGKGAIVAVSLFDSLVEWMSVPFLQYEGTGKAPQRVGLFHPSIAPYGRYALADGSEMVISIQNETEWQDFAREVLAGSGLESDPRFARNSLRVENRPALEALVAGMLKGMPVAELTRRLDKARTAYSFVSPIEDLPRHPHLRRLKVAVPGGEASVPAPAARWDRPAGPVPRVPAIDEHGAAIRKEFG